jgi:hypothetical protein
VTAHKASIREIKELVLNWFQCINCGATTTMPSSNIWWYGNIVLEPECREISNDCDEAKEQIKVLQATEDWLPHEP